MKHVPRIGRILDLAGLLLFLVGAGFYARAWFGFRRVQSFVPDPDSGPWAAVRLADGYLRLQKIGVGLMVSGIAVFLAAWWMARRGGRDQGEEAREPPER